MDSCDDPAAPRSILDYADTPLRALAVAEVNDASFAELRRETALERNLAILERLIPPACTDLDAAHAYLEAAISNARATFPVAEATLAAWDRRSDTEFPLLGKVAILAIAKHIEGLPADSAHDE
jgi:hypothetical protein